MARLAIPPPPPRPLRQRAHPRLQLFCAVKVLLDEALALSVRNLSAGGLAVASDGHDLSAFAVGSCHELLVFDAADEQQPTLRAVATVVWRDGLGMGLSWTGKD